MVVLVELELYLPLVVHVVNLLLPLVAVLSELQQVVVEPVME